MRDVLALTSLRIGCGAAAFVLIAACGDDTEVQLTPDASGFHDATVDSGVEAGGLDAGEAGDAPPDTTVPLDAPSEAADAPADGSEDAADAAADAVEDSPEAGGEAGEPGDSAADAPSE
jgi:hypothetical protein